jgi:ABC-type transport system involved in multi-copper enzyme maturation permease subunit
MFWHIFNFELQYRRKRISTYVFAIVLFLLANVLVVGIGGTIPGLTISLGGGGTKTLANSPYVTAMLLSALAILSMFITAALMANVTSRDYEHKVHGILFTKPMNRYSFLLARFSANIVVLIIINLFFGLGLFTGSLLPWIDPAYFGPAVLLSYLQPYWVMVVPNIIFSAAIFFAVGSLTRKSFAVYVSAFVLFIGYQMADTLIGEMDYEKLAALLDPFGFSAMSLVTKNWTITEINSLFIPFTGALMLNRLLWMGVAVALLIFSMSHFKTRYYLREGKKEKLPPETGKTAIQQVPVVNRKFGFSLDWKQFVNLTGIQTKSVMKSLSFVIIVFFGILFCLSVLMQSGMIYGTPTYPLTWMVIESINGSILLLMVIFITIHAAELIWKERSWKSDLIFDSNPVSTVTYIMSKFTALIFAEVVFLTIMSLVGIGYQLFRGFDAIDLPLYLTYMIGMKLPGFFILTVIVFFIHTVVNNKYTGHFFVVGYYLLNSFLPKLGIEHPLLRLFSGSSLIYSDMNGFGYRALKVFTMSTHWVLFALLLLIITVRIWPRGRELLLRIRAARLLDFSSAGYRIPLFAIVGLFVVSNVFHFYHMNILNTFHTSRYYEKAAVKFERTYKQYEGIAQPKIYDVNLNVDLYPKSGGMECAGYFRMRNKTDEVIDSLHVMVDTDYGDVQMSMPVAAELVVNDVDYGYYIYKLQQPLHPGDTLQLNFALKSSPKGFIGSSNTLVNKNGTFFHSSALPHIGYSDNLELANNKIRRKYDLPDKARMPLITDESAYGNNYVDATGDWIQYEAVVSTDADQIALTTGELMDDHTEGDRRFFHYRMPVKMLNFYTFLSARYQIERATWHDVPIEIYYTPGHEYNIERMITGVQRSLDYYDANYGPYPYPIVRIAEFPRYYSFAQSFPTLIPFSESIGFIAEVGEDDIDYPLFVTTHEMAHHYWAHQVIGAGVQGSLLFSEGLAQYSALQVMHQQLRPEQMREFLRRELRSYLMARSSETEAERPLYLDEGQGYIHYNKGSYVMYSFARYLGDDVINTALAKFVKDYGCQEPPYPTSLDFLPYIEAVCPDSLNYLIDDMFRTITLYDNRVVEASCKKLDSGKYQVDATVEMHKMRADSLGVESEVPMHDLIELAVFEQDGSGQLHTLTVQEHWLDAGMQHFSFEVDFEPKKVAVDTFYRLIDRDPDNNMKEIKKRGDA